MRTTRRAAALFSLSLYIYHNFAVKIHSYRRPLRQQARPFTFSSIVQPRAHTAAAFIYAAPFMRNWLLLAAQRDAINKRLCRANETAAVVDANNDKPAELRSGSGIRSRRRAPLFLPDGAQGVKLDFGARRASSEPPALSQALQASPEARKGGAAQSSSFLKFRDP
uniref:Uncharacterized protein n=1 Tax=Plectus sambesii TaxID=2011161 RepID=A0A914VJZ9_9BILA